MQNEARGFDEVLSQDGEDFLDSGLSQPSLIRLGYWPPTRSRGGGSFGFHFSKAVGPLTGKVGRLFETAIKTRNAMPTAVLQHFAAALESGCKHFASLDARQRARAKLDRLELHPAIFPRDVWTRKS